VAKSRAVPRTLCLLIPVGFLPAKCAPSTGPWGFERGGGKKANNTLRCQVPSVSLLASTSTIPCDGAKKSLTQKNNNNNMCFLRRRMCKAALRLLLTCEKRFGFCIWHQPRERVGCSFLSSDAMLSKHCGCFAAGLDRGERFIGPEAPRQIPSYSTYLWCFTK
jgi:hypothetical protein